jgi:hypothetical protein
MRAALLYAFLQQHHKPLCRPELKTLTVSSLRGIRKQKMEHHYSLLRKVITWLTLDFCPTTMLAKSASFPPSNIFTN